MSCYICRQVKKKCWNLWDSFGEICVGCGCCSDDPVVRAKARLEVCERMLEEEKNCDTTWYCELQKKNLKVNIRYFSRRVRYYMGRVKELEQMEESATRRSCVRTE